MIRLVLNLGIWNVRTINHVNDGTEYHIASKVALVVENVQLENMDAASNQQNSSVNIGPNASVRPVSKTAVIPNMKFSIGIGRIVVCTRSRFTV